MKILYAIQGTGNGHLSRALDIIPHLEKQASIDLLISGKQADLKLPYPVKFQLPGLGYYFGQRGGIDLWKSLINSNFMRLVQDIMTLPVQDYDLVISDFEPISAWACRLKGKLSIGLSHQSAVLDKSAPKPERMDRLGLWVLKNYAPTSLNFGFHFKSWGDNNFTPIIRKEIREAEVKDLGHVTVYLPAYEDGRLIDVLTKIDSVKWEVFSKHNQQEIKASNVSIYPINRQGFVNSLVRSQAVLCGAGFETPSEALYLGKKLLVIPMKGQFEQLCNAAALRSLGVTVHDAFNLESVPHIHRWLTESTAIKMDYLDQSAEIVEAILKIHPSAASTTNKLEANPVSIAPNI